jgi:predicted dehydrogenase
MKAAGVNMKAAVVGLGRVGFEFSQVYARDLQPASHLGCQIQLYGISNVAACDINPHRLLKAKRYFRLEHCFRSVERLMSKFQPELVAIATPTNTHAEIVEHIAQYSCVKTIFLEKPLATSIAEGEQILKACRSIRLVVNFTRRWSTVYRRAKQLVASIEPVLSVIGTHPGPLLRTGTHMLDLFNFLLSHDPVVVQAFGTVHKSEYMKQTDDWNINGVVTYPHVEAVLLSGPERPYVLFELDIHGEKGRITVTDNGLHLRVAKVEDSKNYSGLKELADYVSEHVPVLNRSLILNAYEEIARFSGSSSTGWDAFNCLRTALALNWSATRKRYQCVTLDEVPKDYIVGSL